MPLGTCARSYDHQRSNNTQKTCKIELTEIGKIIENQWNQTPNLFDSVVLDEFVIMPNAEGVG